MEQISKPTLLDMDLAALLQLPPNSISEWCYTNRSEIQASLAQRIKKMQTACPIKTNVDPQRYQYSTELLSQRKDIEQFPASYLLLQVIDLGTRYKGLSCNQILFGEEKLVELFGPPAAFIKALDVAKPEQMLHVLSLLEKGKCETNNAEYVLKRRWEDLAASMGRPLMSLLTLCTVKTKYRDVTKRFVEGDPRRVIQRFSRKADFICSGAALQIVLMASLISNISADYYMLLDYSDLAAIDGVPLSGIQKSLLSLYLKADQAAQQEALLYLLKCVLSNER